MYDSRSEVDVRDHPRSSLPLSPRHYHRLSSVDTASLARPQSVPMRNLCCFILLALRVGSRVGT
jgi:hypothetical protein